jgi:uncharacterized protein YndB with AHSA1/START domain
MGGMVTLEASVFIDQPVAAVFAFVGDQHNAPRWQKGLLEVRKTTEGPLGVGTRHDFSRRVMGLMMTAGNEYTAYEPNRRIAFKTTSGPMQLQACYTTEASGNGTQLTCTIEIEKGSGLFRLMLPLIVRSIRKDMRENFVTLKGLLEQKTGS